MTGVEGFLQVVPLAGAGANLGLDRCSVGRAGFGCEDGVPGRRDGMCKGRREKNSLEN